MKTLPHIGMLVLVLGMSSCGQSDAASSSDAVAALLVSGFEADTTGVLPHNDQTLPWKIELISSKPYTVQLNTIGERHARWTVAVEQQDACRYKVTQQVIDQVDPKGNGPTNNQEYTVDFRSLIDFRPLKTEQGKDVYQVRFGDSCASTLTGCMPELRIPQFAVSPEKMQKAVSDMKAICKPQ